MHKIASLMAMITITASAYAQSVPGQTMPMQGMGHINMEHATHMAAMNKAQREEQVAELGKDVMPFDLATTLHIFTKDAEGGIQQVVARNKSDKKQTALVRQHLKDIQGQFLRQDFSGPSHIHGVQMPGLADLQAAEPGQIAIEYKEVKGGAQLAYRTAGGCPEFCVNGASVNSWAFSPRTGW